MGKHTLQNVNFTDYPLLEWISFRKNIPADGIITLKKKLPSFRFWFAEHCALTSFPNLSEAPNLIRAQLHTGLFTSIPPEYLAGSTKLRYLTLLNGKLNSLPVMDNMIYPRELVINNNDLTTLPYLYHLPHRIIKMQHNHWVCDQALCWVRMWPFTVYPKKYAHGFCFAVLCCGYTLTDFPISIRLTSLALWQSNDCPSASKATLMNMDKYFLWIHYERLHNHNKAKHNKTVCIFLGIYCMKDLSLVAESMDPVCSHQQNRIGWYAPHGTAPSRHGVL